MSDSGLTTDLLHGPELFRPAGHSPFFSHQLDFYYHFSKSKFHHLTIIKVKVNVEVLVKSAAYMYTVI